MTALSGWKFPLAGLALFTLATAGCGSGTSESALGQLRIRPAFVEGEHPDAFGVDVERVRVVVRRGGAAGEVVVDTTLAFEAGATMSWILDLASLPEMLDVSADLDGGGRLLYRGSLQASVSAGVGSGVAVTDVLVRYIGPVVTAIEVTPPEVTLLSHGSTQQFQAVARGPDGTPQAGFAFAWSSSNPAVATVDPVSGLATVVAAGTAFISATAAGKVGTAKLNFAPFATIVVQPSTASLAAFGAHQQFVAQALDASGVPVPGVVFAWSSDAPAIAAIDPVTGLANALANGVTGVSASAAGITGSSTLTVRQAIASIAVAPGNASLGALGSTLPFSAQARDANGFLVEDAVFAWTTANPSVATVGAISGVASSVGVGSTSVVATVGGVSGSNSLAVSQIVASIVVTPATAFLTSLGATQQYSAVAFDANGHLIPGVQFTWSSSVPAVAAVDPSSGLATAAASGSTTIGATAGGVTATGALTVTQQGQSLTVLPAHAILGDLGATQQFTAVVTDVGGSPLAGVVFAWGSSIPAVATIGSNGLATANGFGVATITVSGAGLSGIATLAVIQTVASVDVVPPSASIASGSTLAFTAVARDAGGNIVPGATILWSSSAPLVASVNLQSGLVTGVGAGTATIIASAGTATGQATLSVTAGGVGAVGSVTVSPDPGFIDALGDTRMFQAVARDAHGNVMPGIFFTWSSSQPAVASVDQTGLATGAATGNATLTAAAGGIAGSATVHVRQIVASISVQPPQATLGLGDSIPLTAVARDARGNLIPGVSFVWSSTDPAVATADANGLVRAVAAGSATVRAAANGITGTAVLDVANVGSIVISPGGEPKTQVGAKVQFTAQVFDAAGNLLPGVRVTWSSSQPLVASIDGSSGLATALKVGNSIVSAVAGGASGQALLVVKP